jgi:hypothetical protein
MLIENARIEGGELVLTTSDTDARQFAYNFKPGHYEIKPKAKKRSLNANAYCWDLCTRIAAAVGMSKEDVYRRNIREVGTYTPMPIKEEAIKEFGRIWKAHGVGWFIDIVDDSKIPGYKLIFAYHGSSTYTTAEMSRLIDNLIQDAKSVGIETLSDREKSLLIDEWENENKKI